jgi:hypothetical protein
MNCNSYLASVRAIGGVVAGTVGALVLAAPAAASQLVDRDAKNVRLAVNTKGEALISYSTGGRARRVLAWGGLDARHPSRGRAQVKFQLDYSGGFGKYRRDYAGSFSNGCHRYDGPRLAYLVAACGAPDGSYWAVQSWQTPLPDLGLTPWKFPQASRELHLSHWTGQTALIEAWTDWSFGGQWHSLFGRVTYKGVPVHGFSSTRLGAPTDSYGRLVYIDTFDSVYGKGWKRENAILTHNPNGIFCYGFVPHDPTIGYDHPAGWPKGKLRGPANGSRYRVTVNGPGATPDVTVTVPGLHDFDRANPADVEYEQKQNALLDSIRGADTLCHH